MRIFLIAILISLTGCQKGYEGQREIIREKQRLAIESARSEFGDLRGDLKAMNELPEWRALASYRDSLLNLGPSIRYYSDSLAREDSAIFAMLLFMQVGELFQAQDTVSAVYAYLEALPWIDAFTNRGQVTYAESFANVVGRAVEVTHSPRMASLAFQAFERADQLAFELGDTLLLTQVEQNRAKLKRQLLNMPDSVRLAFAPAPPSSTNNPWTFVAVALVLGFIVGGGTWKLYRVRSKANPAQPGKGTTLEILDALWIICNDVKGVPEDVLKTVRQVCKGTQHQRAMFMQAGLMANVDPSDNPDPLRVSNTVRSRLLRYFRRNEWEMMPGVQLPRDRDEWYTWLNSMGCTHRTPSDVLGDERTREAE